MLIEAELTAVLRDPGRVRAELAGRALPESCVYADTYYDRPDRGLDTAGYEVRVRAVTRGEDTQTFLTYKEPAVTEWGAKPEYETTVGDSSVLRAVFGGLGLVELIAFRKHCENYRFTAQGRDLVATVVQIPELEGQTFLELETMAEQEDLAGAHAVLRDVLHQLGGSTDDLTTESYTDRVAARRA